MNLIYVEIKSDGSKDRNVPIKEFLDYVDNNYCLVRGKWFRFNESYIKYLEEEVDKIKINYEPWVQIPLSPPNGNYKNTIYFNGGFVVTVFL